MNDRARKLLADAMTLPPEERADLAEGLLATLPDDGADPAWTAEIERRARRAWAEPDGGEPWVQVEARLRSRLAGG